MASIQFTKMHGTGNDFIMVDRLQDGGMGDIGWEDLARKVCDRHFGIGADGLILLLPSTSADFRMRMFNPDGSEAQMCGNGIRCCARYSYDRGLTTTLEPAVETLAGTKEVRLSVAGGAVEGVRINMGIPVFAADKIPAKSEQPVIKDYPLAADGRAFTISCVSMGNPHAITFLDEGTVNALDLGVLGPRFEYHPMFPERTNTEFCAVLDRRHIRMRVWERGAGETLACGTGATAAAVAAIDHGLVDSPVEMILDGGRLLIEWQGYGQSAFMTGPAAYICDGEYYYER